MKRLIGFSTADPSPYHASRAFRVAEFFAGIGLIRAAVERAGGEVVFANDIEPFKHRLYMHQWGKNELVVGDVRNIHGEDVPDVELATASFPCTDLSLAGYRRGFSGAESSMFWEFARVLNEMGARRPPVILLENVPSFATSKGGDDLANAIRELNGLGYWCDLLVMDARWFVPQSRQRLFVIGTQGRIAPELLNACPTLPGFDPIDESPLRPSWLTRTIARYDGLLLQAVALPEPPSCAESLRDIVERLDLKDRRWWDTERIVRFIDSLSPLHVRRLDAMRRAPTITWATAYRRTRQGRAVWEIRGDGISGCLRAARGGSSKQALVQAGCGEVHIRWMTAREYAALQGVPEFRLPTSISENQALFGFGDAVCVPAVEWLLENYVRPLLLTVGA